MSVTPGQGEHSITLTQSAGVKKPIGDNFEGDTDTIDNVNTSDSICVCVCDNLAVKSTNSFSQIVSVSELLH